MEFGVLNQSEYEALQKELEEVLIKHNVQMTVSSKIEFIKVIEDEDTEKIEEITKTN